jgi:LacI family transcriptional regulator
MDHCADKIEELMKNNTFDAIFAVNELFAVTSIKLAS